MNSLKILLPIAAYTLTVALASVNPNGAAKVPSDRPSLGKVLEGTWDVTRCNESGIVFANREETLVIQGNRLTRIIDDVEHATIFIDDTHVPKVFVRESKPVRRYLRTPKGFPEKLLQLPKKTTAKEIYKFDDKNLTICYNSEIGNQKIPDKFTSSPENKNVLQIWERLGEPADGDTDQDRLEGQWRLVRLLASGRERTDEREVTMTYRKGATSIAIRDIIIAMVHPVPEEGQGAVDITYLSSPLKGQTYPAIYEVLDGSLRLCQGTKRNGRPTKFEAPDNSGRKLWECRRRDP